MKQTKPKLVEPEKNQPAVAMPKAATISTPAGGVRIGPADFIKLCLDMAQGIKSVSQIRKAISFIDEAEDGSSTRRSQEAKARAGAATRSGSASRTAQRP